MMGVLKERLKYLLNQYSNGLLTTGEAAELEDMLSGGDYDHLIQEALRDMLSEHRQTEAFSEKAWEPLLLKILDSDSATQMKEGAGRREQEVQPPVYAMRSYKRSNIIKWMAAAGSIIFIITTLYLFWGTPQNTLRQVAEVNKSSVNQVAVKPGGNKAYLTLSDGTVVNLDSMAAGSFTTQGSARIVKSGNGQLEYVFSNVKNSVPVYNTITTPKGGKYKIILPDGTKVWLNAGSSLRFPVAFTGKSRNVYLQGEGYFEVSKDPVMPFYVNAGNSLVEVLGTHFNVNAYEDEDAVSTTLLEGKVKVDQNAVTGSTTGAVILKPGEQADLSKSGRITTRRDVNIDEVVAWKEGFFDFKNIPVTDLMRQIVRWYDVDIEYRGEVPDTKLTGKISRDVNLDKLIDMLQYAGLNMKVENRTIMIGNE
ncbi:MAG: FecR domain-containing protein [Chitinophagaceae bacterium]|nr:FecR domain-containing protein [Chitinophagaceae bacterium]